ncbi:MAG: hypothetical protein EA343_19130 [Nodularia sp. (in: Bacteria)]|nr:MAG: hypothetical protein EA343_19130 [Nodularia sp. (in: cyanobacteria)]
MQPLLDWLGNKLFVIRDFQKINCPISLDHICSLSPLLRCAPAYLSNSYLSNAQELLVDATRIFKLQGNSERACIFNVRDQDTGITFTKVFVRRQNAIVTFYPDATPQGANCKR